MERVLERSARMDGQHKKFQVFVCSVGWNPCVVVCACMHGHPKARPLLVAHRNSWEAGRSADTISGFPRFVDKISVQVGIEIFTPF